MRTPFSFIDESQIKMKRMMKHYIRKTFSLMALLAFSTGVWAQDVTETVTTVADQGKSGMYLVTFCPQKDVAIGKDDADVFSIYMDMGIPYLCKLRVRSGQFVIKAGEPVVVKTFDEAKAVKLWTSDKPSSTFFNDVVCLSADQKVADYRKTNSVADDATIYLLTNMAKNGGFGFTKFTGDTMRKGNFFIVVSASKTRAANDIEDGDPVPMLDGEAGNDDGFTAQSTYAKGDANGDGKVNVADIVEIVNYMVGTPTIAFLFSPADVNDDGKVNTADIDLIVNSITGK